MSTPYKFLIFVLLFVASISINPIYVQAHSGKKDNIKIDYCYDVLIESQKEYLDIYYKYLKKRGLYDFVYEMVTPEDNVDAIRVDVMNNYPRTILTEKITSSNMGDLVSSLKILTNIEYL